MRSHAPLLIVPLVGASLASGQCDPDLLVPPDLLPGDGYGVSAAIDAGHALVGAYDATVEAGAVYTLRRVAGELVLDDKITPADADEFDQFGSSVALAGQRAVIGAPLDEVNGFASGSAYVFEFDDARQQWVERAKLLAPDGSPYDLFALDVATTGGFAFAGCPEDDDTKIGAGSVYVFARRDDAWTHTQKLLAGDADTSERFGEAIDADADTLVVGASLKKTAGTDTGAAYVFTLQGDAWEQQARLLPPEPQAHAEFGLALAVSGDLVAVGAPSEDAAASDAGAVHVFRRTDGAWTHEALIAPDDAAEADGFGASVSIHGSTLLIGSRSIDPESGIVGAAYLYRRAAGGGWSFVRRFAPSEELEAHYFGWSVGLDAQGAIVGAPFGAGLFAETGSSFSIDLAGCVCEADLNLDGVLSILDFVTLQQAFLAGDPGADVNADGDLTVLDFVDYQALFLAGCP